MPLSLSISTRLRHQHESLSDLIAGLSETQLKIRVNPDKWSVFEQIAHLAAYQPVFQARLKRLANETDPAFGRYVAEEDPLFPDYLAKPLEPLLAEIGLRGREIAAQLENWDEAGLGWKGRHAKYGLMDVVEWTDFFLLHEAHHLFAIFMLTRELRERTGGLP